MTTFELLLLCVLCVMTIIILYYIRQMDNVEQELVARDLECSRLRSIGICALSYLTEKASTRYEFEFLCVASKTIGSGNNDYLQKNLDRIKEAERKYYAEKENNNQEYGQQNICFEDAHTKEEH